MTFILISGERNAGKTRVCNRVYRMLKADPSFAHIDYTTNLASVVDLMAHFEKGGKHIVMNAASDGDKCMIEFCKYLDSLKERPDIIITTIREHDDRVSQMTRMLALLDAYAKGKTVIKMSLEDYYRQHIANFTSFAPDALSTHAFVLHLEKQPVSGTEEEQEQALAPHWDKNAETAKQMLDLAIARL